MTDPQTYDQAVAELRQITQRLREQAGMIADLRERLVAHQGELEKKNAQLQMAWHKQDLTQNELTRLATVSERAALTTMRLEEALARIGVLDGKLAELQAELEAR